MFPDLWLVIEPTTGRVWQRYDHCFLPHVRGLLIAQQLLPHNFYVEMTPVSFNSRLIYLFIHFKSLTGVHDLAARGSTSLRKHPFLLALRRWGRFAGRNVCDSATENPY